MTQTQKETNRKAPCESIWLKQARQVFSPNCDLRPPGCVISLLVLHNISLPPGEFGGHWIEDLFLNQLDCAAHPFFAQICTLRVSAHLLIVRDGSLIQFVPLEQRAWHAGLSSFSGTERCNDYSIGIELEGTDDLPFTDAQYERLTEVTRSIRNLYPAITPERICGHSDIAPDRKTDPGPCFDWQRFRASL